MESIWITGKRFWKAIFTRLIHLEIFLKEFHLKTCAEIEKQYLTNLRGRASLTSGDGQNYGAIPMPTFASGPVELPQNYVVGQQRQQMSELQFDKFPNPQSFLVWKFDSKPQSPPVLIFHRMLCCGSAESKSSRSVYGKDFPNFEMLDAKIASALNKIIQNSQFKKKVILEEQEAQKEDRFLRGRQIAFMIYDYCRVTGAHDPVLDYGRFFLSPFMTTMFRNSIPDGTKFYYLCQRFHPMKSWKV